jgi:hypothetical protein
MATSTLAPPEVGVAVTIPEAGDMCGDRRSPALRRGRQIVSIRDKRRDLAAGGGDSGRPTGPRTLTGGGG